MQLGGVSTGKPYIKILSKEMGGVTKVQIKDNEEGIAPQSRERIFEMFFRGSSSSTGSGLGLYIERGCGKAKQNNRK